MCVYEWITHRDFGGPYRAYTCVYVCVCVFVSLRRCIEKGNHHVLQCLPRMLTLYCDHGTDQLNRGQKAYGAKEKAASASVR